MSLFGKLLRKEDTPEVIEAANDNISANLDSFHSQLNPQALTPADFEVRKPVLEEHFPDVANNNKAPVSLAA